MGTDSSLTVAAAEVSAGAEGGAGADVAVGAEEAAGTGAKVPGSVNLFLALATLSSRESFVTSPPVISRSTPVVESAQEGINVDYLCRIIPNILVLRLTYEVDARDNHDGVDS